MQAAIIAASSSLESAAAAAAAAAAKAAALHLLFHRFMFYTFGVQSPFVFCSSSEMIIVQYQLSILEATGAIKIFPRNYLRIATGQLSLQYLAIWLFGYFDI